MIRFSPWGAYLLLVPQRGKVLIWNRLLIMDKAVIDEIKTAESEAKLWCLFDWGSKRLENGLVFPESFSARMTIAKQLSKILRQDLSFEGPVHSCRHHSLLWSFKQASKGRWTMVDLISVHVLSQCFYWNRLGAFIGIGAFIWIGVLIRIRGAY